MKKNETPPTFDDICTDYKNLANTIIDIHMVAKSEGNILEPKLEEVCLSLLRLYHKMKSYKSLTKEVSR